MGTFTPFTPEQQGMLSLLCSSLWGDSSSLELPEGVDWPDVYQELRHQTVEGLTIETLIQRDPARKGAYFQWTTRKLSHFFSIMDVQQELCGVLEEHGIPSVVLKGTAAAIYYPQPTYRTMGDVDLLVKPEQYDLANKILESHGCRHYGKDNFRHSEWRYKGVLIELHRCFSVRIEGIVSHPLDQMLYAGMERREEVSLEGFSFPMLPRLENGIVLLQHISQHMEHGLGLRQIIDWMFFVDKELSDAWWASEFQAATQLFGLETLAVTVARMCQMYLGLRSSLTWCSHAEEDLCRDLMEYVLEQGNFGRKKGTDHNKTVFVLSAAQNIPHFLKLLHRHGCINWKATQKYPWLKPFAGVYQAGRYVHLGLQRKNPIQMLWKDAKQSRSQDAFYDRLGVVRQGKNNRQNG